MSISLALNKEELFDRLHFSIFRENASTIKNEELKNFALLKLSEIEESADRCRTQQQAQELGGNIRQLTKGVSIDLPEICSPCEIRDKLFFIDIFKHVRQVLDNFKILEKGTVLKLPSLQGCFCGRTYELKKLKLALSETGRVVLAGLGGSGKTALALRFALENKQSYKFVHFISASSIEEDFSILASYFKLPIKGYHEELKKSLLELEDPYLLIVDDIESEKELEKWLPEKVQDLIATSRNQNSKHFDDFTIQTLSSFTVDAVDYILNATNSDDIVSAKAIAQKLGSLPLAVEQTVQYIESIQVSLSGFLECYNQYGLKLFEREDIFHNHKTQNLLQVLQSTLEKAFIKNPFGKNIIGYLSSLEADCATRADLMEWKSQYWISVSYKKFYKSLLQIEDFLLIKSDNKSIEIHKTVKAYVKFSNIVNYSSYFFAEKKQEIKDTKFRQTFRKISINIEKLKITEHQVPWEQPMSGLLKTIRSEVMFDKADWETYFGEIGEEPPLPPNIEEILKSTCPFWPDKRVEETHLLVFVPQTVNGVPLTLNSLSELINVPKKGFTTKFRYYFKELRREYGGKPISSSHWVLLTKDVIPNSRRKSYKNQRKLIAGYGEYEVPRLIDVVVGIMMYHAKTGERLYPDGPLSYTRCEEALKNGRQTVVGGFSPGGLSINAYYSDYFSVGVGGSRKF